MSVRRLFQIRTGGHDGMDGAHKIDTKAVKPILFTTTYTALRMMHSKNAHPWTISSLAEQAGMSRSVFAAKFKEKVGTSPMSYLTRCRINTAQQLLRNSSLSIEQVAVSVGYDSEAAFNKAFKRQLGVPPGRYRQNK